MVAFVDAYEILGVTPRATQVELKAARRALVRRHHPDVVPPSEREAATRRVRDINVAYGLVRTPQARARYDRLRRLHIAEQAADRLRRQSFSGDVADQWAGLLQAAGRWAGGLLDGKQSVSQRAGRAVGRWLS